LTEVPVSGTPSRWTSANARPIARPAKLAVARGWAVNRWLQRQPDPHNTRKNREKSTKTDAVKHVPVHPVLAAMLAEWKLGGWAEMMGRAPTADDLIVPLPPDAAERRRSRSGEPFRGHDYSGKRWREEDLPALGWRHRRHYDMRATFITLAIEDGADPEILEMRVAHTRK
jgi:hypothetical protein